MQCGILPLLCETVNIEAEYPLSPQHIYVTRVNIPSFDGLLTGVPLSVEYADVFLSAFFLRKYDGGALQLAN